MASSHASIDTESTRRLNASTLLRYGLAGVMGATGLNLAILYGALALFAVPEEFVGGPFGPLAAGPVVVNTVVAGIGATVVYGLIARYATRPNRVFVLVAAVALLLSFGMFGAPDLAGAPLAVFLVLGAMHLAAAVVLVGILTRVPASEASSSR